MGEQDGQENPDAHMVMPEEEIIQNLHNQVVDPPMAKEQVLAMDDDTDTDSEPYPQVQLPIPPVEIVPFPDFNNLQPLMPEEIQEEDLMGWIIDQNNEVAQPQQPEENIQLGIVQLHDSWP